MIYVSKNSHWPKSDCCPELTFATLLIQRKGWCLAVITATNCCVCEWMNSVGRCCMVVRNVTSSGRDSHLPSSLRWVNRHGIVCCNYKLHLQCDGSAWLYFICQWDGNGSGYCFVHTLLPRPVKNKLEESGSCTTNNVSASSLLSAFDCGYHKVISCYHTN